MRYIMETLSTIHNGRQVQAVEVRDSRGNIEIREAHYTFEEYKNNIHKALDSLLWGIKQFNCRMWSKIDNSSKLIICTSSTIYKWVEKESSPKEYLNKLNELLIELSCSPCEVEVISYKGVRPKVNMNIAELLDMGKTSTIAELMSEYEDNKE